MASISFIVIIWGKVEHEKQMFQVDIRDLDSLSKLLTLIKNIQMID